MKVEALGWTLKTDEYNPHGIYGYMAWVSFGSNDIGHGMGHTQPEAIENALQDANTNWHRYPYISEINAFNAVPSLRRAAMLAT